MHPSATWRETVETTNAIYDEVRLAACKFLKDERHVGTGGGNDVVVHFTSNFNACSAVLAVNRGSNWPDCRNALALLWQIFFRPRAAEPYSTVRASLQWSHDDVDDGVTHGGQAWL